MPATTGGPAATNDAADNGATGSTDPDPGTTGMVDAGAPGDPDPTADADVPVERMDLGEGDGSDVVTIGDSWMSYALNGGGIERGLREASGQRYRNYGVAGTKLLDEVIPNQYARAKRDNPDIKTVVMTGGGNDILLALNLAGPKATIDQIAERLDALFQEMGDDGVQDVVYIEYSEGGGNADNVQYGIEKVGPVCQNHKGVRCHFMLSDPVIMMRLMDGVHPTRDGCTKLGQAAYDLMVAEGMRR